MNALSIDAVLTITFIIKIMILLALIVYAAFSLVLISQIRIKRKTVATELGPILEILSYIHAGASIILIIITYLIL